MGPASRVQIFFRCLAKGLIDGNIFLLFVVVWIRRFPSAEDKVLEIGVGDHERRGARSVEPLVVGPRETAVMLGCSIATLYGKLLAELESYVEGEGRGRRRIVVSSIHALIARRLAAQQGQRPDPGVVEKAVAARQAGRRQRAKAGTTTNENKAETAK